MKCPYCLSEVDTDASVCKVCTKDLYLLKPLTQKIENLESKLKEFEDIESLKDRILELENEVAYEKNTDSGSFRSKFISILKFLVIPLFILLVCHALIIVIYDLNLIFLRVASILIPLPFGYFLFSSRKLSVTPWFLGSWLLAFLTVIGMSYITGVVDKTPVMPQNPLEWREFIEYSISISSSFLTGMLLGSISQFKKTRHKNLLVTNPLVLILINLVVKQKLTPENIQKIIQKATQYISIATTALSVITGLRKLLF
jgi:hypothetical protein